MPDYFNTLDVPQTVDTRELLAVGEESVNRTAIGAATLGPASQQLRLVYVVARKTEIKTKVRTTTIGAAGATPSLVRFGVWSINAAGDGTLIASTANDTALFAGAGTAYEKTFSAPYTTQAGLTYAWGWLIVSAAAMPTFPGVNPTPAPELLIAPRLTGLIAGQADLPASFANASVTASSHRTYIAVLP